MCAPHHQDKQFWMIAALHRTPHKPHGHIPHPHVAATVEGVQEHPTPVWSIALECGLYLPNTLETISPHTSLSD